MTIPWRLITDNPPLDGTRVLLWIPSLGFGIYGKWEHQTHAIAESRPYWAQDGHGSFWSTVHPPSHWAPAPEGPVTA